MKQLGKIDLKRIATKKCTKYQGKTFNRVLMRG